MLPLIAAGAAAAATYLGWAAMHPASQLYGRTRTHGSNPRQVALTFDDGPNDPWTLKLLEVLERHDVKATFFLIGKYVEQRPDIARAIVAAGHAVGNHTWSHPNLALIPAGRVIRELTQCQSAIEDAVGHSPRLFRPPWGGRRPAVLQAAERLGLKTIMWNVSSTDWSAGSPEFVESRVRRGLLRKAGTAPIVLLHDGSHKGFGYFRGHTVAAVDRLLTQFKEQGRACVSLPELE